jgi:hypothetical protein
MKSVIFVLLFVALATYLSARDSCKRHVMHVKMLSMYPNATEVDVATIAAKIYDDKNEAEIFYGFNIEAKAVIPVQLTFDSKDIYSIATKPSQTFAVRWQN